MDRLQVLKALCTHCNSGSSSLEDQVLVLGIRQMHGAVDPLGFLHTLILGICQNYVSCMLVASYTFFCYIEGKFLAAIFLRC